MKSSTRFWLVILAICLLLGFSYLIYKVSRLEKLIPEALAEHQYKEYVKTPSKIAYLELENTPAYKAVAPRFATNSASCEQYRPLLAQYSWNVDTMLRIMKAESGCRPESLNNNPRTRDYSVGLLQVNLYGKLKASRPPEAELKIPQKNIEASYKIFKSQGYKAWTTF